MLLHLLASVIALNGLTPHNQSANPMEAFKIRSMVDMRPAYFTKRWTYTNPARGMPIMSAAVGALEGDGHEQLVVLTSDGKVSALTILSTEGHMIRRIGLKEAATEVHVSKAGTEKEAGISVWSTGNVLSLYDRKGNLKWHLALSKFENVDPKKRKTCFITELWIKGDRTYALKVSSKAVTCYIVKSGKEHIVALDPQALADPPAKK
jgi:hypothetical protein